MKDDDMVIVAAQTTAAAPSGQQPRHQAQASARSESGQDIESIRLQTLGNPRLMAEMRDIDGKLAESINDPEAFRRAFMNFETRKREAERERMLEIVSFENPGGDGGDGGKSDG